MTEDVPDLIQPVIGFRCWRLTTSADLHSAGLGDTLWKPGVNRAMCHLNSPDSMMHRSALLEANGARVHDEPAPASDCACGLYCTHRPEGMLAPFSTVIGAVIVWGRIEVHRRGMRSEFARIVALARAGEDRRELIQRGERAAARYGVPLVPLDKLEEEARRHGIEVPRELLPGQLWRWLPPSQPHSSRARKLAIAFVIAWNVSFMFANLAIHIWHGRHWWSLLMASILFGFVLDLGRELRRH